MESKAGAADGISVSIDCGELNRTASQLAVNGWHRLRLGRIGSGLSKPARLQYQESTSEDKNVSQVHGQPARKAQRDVSLWQFSIPRSKHQPPMVRGKKPGR